MVVKAKYPIIALFIVWTAVAAIFAAKLSPLTKEEEFLPADHLLMMI